MENLEQKIQKIEERNQRVEADKAWETSWTRRILLTTFTYLAIGVYMWAIDIARPWLNAVVPAVAFLDKNEQKNPRGLGNKYQNQRNIVSLI